MGNKEKVIRLLESFDIRYNLLDLGASGQTYPPFEALKKLAHFILVDPDDRDFEMTNSSNSNESRIGKAITASEEDDEMKIFLTKNPHCSSTLYPDYKKLEKFAYFDYFKVVDETNVPSTSLNRLAQEYGFKNFDWIKLDTQGTELQILKSLNDTLFDNLLCIDVEISFYAHYQKADTFPELHRFLEQAGFYITHFDYQKRIKMPKAHLNELLKNKSSFMQRQIKKAINPIPTSPEIRYIRNVENKADIDFQKTLKLWGLNYFIENYSQCFYIVNVLEKHFPKKTPNELRTLTIAAINAPRRLFSLAFKRMVQKWANKLVQ